MERNYNEIVLDRDSFAKFSDDINYQRQLLWEKVTQIIYTLTVLNYICVVYDDDIDIIVIQFEHNEKKDAFGIPNPEWVDYDEYQQFLLYKEGLLNSELLNSENNEEQKRNENI